MLRRLMVRFGVGRQARRDRRALPAKAEPRAKLASSTDGSGTLEVNERFDRAWRRVGLALDRVGFTVEDRDRSKGLYFVRYIDPDAACQEGHRLARQAGFWKSSDPVGSASRSTASMSANRDTTVSFRFSPARAAPTSETAKGS